MPLLSVRIFRTPLFALATLAASATQAEGISYSRQIQPLFEQKCVACHACNDAPCQLNLGSGEGLARGANKKQVYGGNRTKADPPTRLFMDAKTTEEWRQKGFYSVLGQQQADANLLMQMVELGRSNHYAANQKLPKDIQLGVSRENSCPADAGEFAKYAKKRAGDGMPLAVTGLTDKEYRRLKAWAAQGGKIDSKPLTATAAEQAQIKDWEALLNRPGLPEKLAARWLYEHLYLAHLYFDENPQGRFFELVRSRTPAGQPLDVIATASANDSPGTDTFYYRIRPIQGALVHKTHITFALTPAKLERTQALFFGKPWNVDALPAYDEAARANPFTTFAAVPAEARYQFMLDNAEYFVRNFIRGPVCRGSLATDVIRDQFWAVFQKPSRDLYITDSAYRESASPLLGLPGQEDGVLDLAPQWLKYRNRRNEYEGLRREAYNKSEPQGAEFADIWDGEGSNDNALLTILRHHDSASVRKGLVGSVPQTIWWMDYPLFERTYYGLVVNYNVYGTVSQGVQTRLYFDLIRNGSEMNFLRLMPPESRQALVDDWYQNSGKLKMWLDYEKPDTKSPTAMRYPRAEDPKEQFSYMLLNRFSPINARPDFINRCVAGSPCFRPEAPAFAQAADQALTRIASKPTTELPVVQWLPESTLLRVVNGKEREVYSILRDRAHSNVAFILGEDWRFQPEKDKLTVVPGIFTSYPNFGFNVQAGEVEDFVNALQAVKTQVDFTAVVERWGVRRTHPKFWEIFSDYTAYLREHEPVEAAILDMNRYENL